MSYWQRLKFQLDEELIYNMVILWCAFGLFRGIGYYQKFREKEDAAAQLSVQLAHAQISALRMQLNRHFLFNTMNSISSLMRTDVAAADTILEQLGSLLRITLEITWTSPRWRCISQCRSADSGRVRQQLSVCPELHDALVPAMILQPLIENAYSHGLSKLDSNGLLVIKATREDTSLTLSVLNNGAGLNSNRPKGCSDGQGVGLANIRSRLKLHYGDQRIHAILADDEVLEAAVAPTASRRARDRNCW
jgi:two-component system, LytTR family, sensor kinase